jgi:uncharacterized protein DUF6662
LAALAVFSIGAVEPAHADEPVFGFIYTTDLLPKNQVEIEQWLTWRGQKAHGSYNLVEGRSEFSYGVTDDFQVSLLAIYDSTEAHRNAVSGATTPPEQFSAYFPDPAGSFRAAQLIGIAVEGIYRIMSPYTDPVGLAIYFEPTVGNRFLEFDTRILVQKNYLDDRLILAANITWAPEIRYLPGNPYAPAGSPEASPNTNIETDVNWGAGASYRFAANWSFAWEFQNEREINEWDIFARSQWMGNAYYTGPSLHYGGEHFFATLTAWEQLPWANNYMHQPVIYKGRDYDVDFENYRVRVKLGYYF